MAHTAITENINTLTISINDYAESIGRDPNEIKIMAVTKNHPGSSAAEAVSAGMTCFGENRVQEALEKYSPSGNNENVIHHPLLHAYEELHLIGHLQSNKAAKAVGLFNWIDTIDSVKILKKVAASAEKIEKKIKVLFEVNVSGEESKHGFRDYKDLYNSLMIASELSSIIPCGLMTVGPLTDDSAKIRASFAALRELRASIMNNFSFENFDTLSMGMSGDWKIAIEEGSTMIRLGTAIFGKRQYK